MWSRRCRPPRHRRPSQCAPIRRLLVSHPLRSRPRILRPKTLQRSRPICRPSRSRRTRPCPPQQHHPPPKGSSDRNPSPVLSCRRDAPDADSGIRAGEPQTRPAAAFNRVRAADQPHAGEPAAKHGRVEFCGSVN